MNVFFMYTFPLTREPFRKKKKKKICLVVCSGGPDILGPLQMCSTEWRGDRRTKMTVKGTPTPVGTERESKSSTLGTGTDDSFRTRWTLFNERRTM